MNTTPKNSPSGGISEDWLAVLIAFVLIALAAFGLLGQTGLNIVF